MITLEGLAVQSGIPSSFLRKLVKRGKVPHKKKDNDFLFDEVGVQAVAEFFSSDENTGEFDVIRTLEGLNYAFEQVNSAKTQKVYYNNDRNVMVVVLPYEEYTEDDVYGGIDKDHFRYLIKTLNGKKNLIVLCEKSNIDSSEYTIFHEIDASKYVGVKATMVRDDLHRDVKSVSNTNYRVNKYGQVTNKNWSKINL